MEENKNYGADSIEKKTLNEVLGTGKIIKMNLSYEEAETICAALAPATHPGNTKEVQYIVWKYLQQLDDQMHEIQPCQRERESGICFRDSNTDMFRRMFKDEILKDPYRLNI